jgi:hypothetical protein
VAFAAVRNPRIALFASAAPVWFPCKTTGEFVVTVDVEWQAARSTKLVISFFTQSSAPQRERFADETTTPLHQH